MTITLDLHVHTSVSACAYFPPAAVARVARQRGISAVAVTDHNTLAGVQAVREAAGSLQVIAGEEIKTTEGELLGYFLVRAIPPGMSPEDTIRAVRDQGGLVSIPHPFDRLRTSRITAAALERILPLVDMIETFNGRDVITLPDVQVLDRARALGIRAVVGSDAHLPLELGRCTVTMDDFSSPEEFLRALGAAHMTTRRSPLWVHLATKIIRGLRKTRA